MTSHLLNMPIFDQHLVNLMDNGNNFVAVAFAVQIVQHYLVEERNSSLITEQDLACTIDALVKIATISRNPPEGLVTLIELLRVNHDNNNMTMDGRSTAYIHSGILQVKVSRMRNSSTVIFFFFFFCHLDINVFLVRSRLANTTPIRRVCWRKPSICCENGSAFTNKRRRPKIRTKRSACSCTK